MELLELTDGALVFQPGDRSTHAYRVESGAVEVLIGDLSPAVLTRYGPGEVFGEIGLLEGRLRRYGARAVGATRLTRLDLDQWSESCLGTPAQAQAYLRGLFRRVREVDEGLIRLPPSEAPRTGTPRVRLVPASPDAEKALPAGELHVRSFPFRIGRASHGSEAEHSPPDLLLDDRAPHNVSRVHAALEVVAGRVIAADLGSSLGTQVNGVRFGGHHHKETECPLRAGRNELVLGGPRSPHRFLVFVEVD